MLLVLEPEEHCFINFWERVNNERLLQLNQRNNMSTKTVGDRELLIRIDERQSNMMDKMTTLNKKMDTMVPNDDEYKETKAKVDSLWDSKNKMIGWLLGSGVVGGSVSVALQNIVKIVFASMK